MRLSLLAATLVLGASSALGQTTTVTMSPTGSRNVTEGDTAVAITVSVANVPQDTTKAWLGLLTIQKTGGVTTGDFNLYDSDPSMGSPSALSFADAPNATFPNIYYVQWNESTATNIPTSGTFNYWLEVRDDSVFEGPEALVISFAIHGGGVGTPTVESATLTINVPPPAPTGKPTTPANLAAAAGRGGEVRLTWDAIDTTSSNTNRVNDVNITKHQYRQATDGDISDETWTDIPQSAYGKANAAGYTVGGLIDDTEYTFQVRAVNGCTTTTGCGNSDPSSSVTGTPGPTGKPTTPANLTATPGMRSVRLTWDAIDETSSNTNVLNDVQITKHQVRQSTDGDISDETWTDIPDSAYGEANAAGYTIRGLIDDTEYTFQVRAVNGCTRTEGCGESDPATAAAWPHSPDRYRISTIAGGVGDGGPATAAQFEEPNGIAADGSGNFYFCDLRGNRIRKVDSSGIITTVTRASVPNDVLVDGSGNLYIADSGNRVVRKVDSSGVSTRVAGTGSQFGPVGDDGPATEATLVFPADLALDGSGNLYIADSADHRIRKVDTAGVITTFAGTGDLGDSGDDGQATEAKINAPQGVAVDGAGNVYIADTVNNRIRKVDSSGVITAFAGTGDYGYRDFDDGRPAIRAHLRRPEDVEVDGSGNIYIADTRSHRIRKVDSSGIITTVAGRGVRGVRGDGGPATSAGVEWPVGIALDGSGNLYITQVKNERIRKVDSSGIITTVAFGDHEFGGDGRRATAALLNRPADVAVDRAGNLYIADRDNHRIRKVNSSGIITTFAGTGTEGGSGDGGQATEAQLKDPNGVAVDRSGNVYIAAQLNHRVRKVDSSGTITAFAGTGAVGFSGDGGPATEARVSRPHGVAVDRAGNVYIVDWDKHRVRKVDSSGTITTIAGTGTEGFGGDGGPATEAFFNYPTFVAVDGAGNVYIADSKNHRIRKVDSSGLITTFAGTGTAGYSFRENGGPATSARLNEPWGVAVDGAGNLYIADTLNHQIRKVDTNGLITTIAGTERGGFSGDGGPATSARLNQPVGIAVDGSGNIYFADFLNDRIRKLTLPQPPLPPPNRPPTVTLSCEPCEVERGGEAMLTATASDPEGDPLAYSWSASDGVIAGPDDTAAVLWTAPDQAGTVTISVRVSDGKGGAAEAQVTVDVLVVVPERMPFDIPDQGTTTSATGGETDSPRTGYGRIRSDGGLATPSGIALLQFRDSEGMLITEAYLPAAAPVLQGRIFAEVGNSVNTAVAFANPNGRPVDISFYLTDTDGEPDRRGELHGGGLRAHGEVPERSAVGGRKRGGHLHLPGLGAGGGDRAPRGHQRGGRVAGDHAAGDAAAVASLAVLEDLDRSGGVPALRRRRRLEHPGDPGQPHRAADCGNAGVSGVGGGPADSDAGRRPDGSELPLLHCRQKRLARGHLQSRRPDGHRLGTGHARRRGADRRGPLRPAGVLVLHRRRQDRLAGRRARSALLDRLPGPDRRRRAARSARLRRHRPGGRQQRRGGGHGHSGDHPPGRIAAVAPGQLRAAPRRPDRPPAGPGLRSARGLLFRPAAGERRQRQGGRSGLAVVRQPARRVEDRHHLATGRDLPGDVPGPLLRVLGRRGRMDHPTDPLQRRRD